MFVCGLIAMSSSISSFIVIIQYALVIDQASGQRGRILAQFLFSVFMNGDGVEVHKNAK